MTYFIASSSSSTVTVRRTTSREIDSSTGVVTRSRHPTRWARRPRPFPPQHYCSAHGPAKRPAPRAVPRDGAARNSTTLTNRTESRHCHGRMPSSDEVATRRRVGPVMSLLRSDRAAPPRTLVAILRETATQWPDDPAVDSGADVADLQRDARGRRGGPAGAQPGRRWSRGPGGRSAYRPAPRSSTSRSSAYCSPERRLRPGRRRRPGQRAGSCSTRRSVRRARQRGPGASRSGRRAHPRASRSAGARGRRLGHLHLGVDRTPEGRGGQPPQRGGVRRRRGTAVPPGPADRARGPGDGRPVGRVRRLL